MTRICHNHTHTHTHKPDQPTATRGRETEHVRGSRGGRGSAPRLKNHKNIGFLSKTGPDPLKNHKTTKPSFNVRSSSADDDPLIAVFYPPYPHQQQKKNVVKFKLDLSDKTFWIRAWSTNSHMPPRRKYK